MQHLCHRALLAALPLVLGAPSIGHAQPVPPTQAEAQAALNPAPTAFTPAQLDQMLAPVALYPDQLLTELLMAATFPQQVIDAGKWLQDGNNAALKGDGLVAALQPLPWDPSVKSLVAFPQIVAMMNDHLDWTEALGAAFANQEVQTMARVQFLRDRAMAAGQLKSTAQITIQQEAGEIVIEPADPAMIYVPVYNPAVIYGAWPDSDDPPVYIPPPPGFYNGEIGAGIGFSVGFGVVGPLWGWGHPDWGRHQVVVDPQRFNSITTTTNITNNHITIENNTWHRTAPFASVPEAQRPHPAGSSEHPPGTVTATAIKPPGAHPAEAAHPGATPPGGETAHPGQEAHPAAAHPGEPPQPAETHPGEPPHSPEAQPAEAHPGEPPHPPEAHPAEARPGEPPHPAEARPAEPPHPAEAHPAEPPHPAEAHPAEPPHPAEAHPAPHPPAGGPPHPAPPAKKPPPKPGEEDKPDQH